MNDSQKNKKPPFLAVFKIRFAVFFT